MKLKKLLMVFLSLSMVLCMVACGDSESGGNSEGGNTSSGPQYGGVLKAQGGQFDDHLDPQAPGASTGTAMWARDVFESPLIVGLDGKVYPLVCTYTVDNEAAPSEIRLKVVEGKKFHDGTDVKIEDVDASLKRTIKRDIFADCTSHTIEGDELVLKFDTSKVNGNSTLYWLGYYDNTYVVMPKRICDKYPNLEGKIILDAADVIGTGCYKMDPTGYVPQDHITLTRFEDYKAITEGGETGNGTASVRHAYLDKIIIYKNTDTNNVLMHLINKDYDVAYTVLDTFESMLAPNGFTMYAPENPTSNNITLLFNLHDDSTSILKDDVNLRKAILAAADMKAITFAEYSNWGIDFHSPLNMDAYDTSKFDSADFCGEANIELCKEYLAKSNYKGQELIFRRPSTAGMAPLQELVQNLNDAGIKAKMEAMELAAYTNDYHQGTTGWDGYMLFANGSNIHPCFIPVNNYYAWDDAKGLELRNKLYSLPAGTPESLAAWGEYVDYQLEQVPCFTIGKSKGDRFVCSPGVVLNYTGYANFMNTYFEDPSAHME